MKLLQITNLSANKNTYNNNQKKQLPVFRGTKTIPLDTLDLSAFKGLREHLSEQMQNEATRNTLFTLLIAGASVLTDIITGGGKVPDSIDELYKQMKANFLNPDNKESGTVNDNESGTVNGENTQQAGVVNSDTSAKNTAIIQEPAVKEEVPDDPFENQLEKYPEVCSFYKGLKEEAAKNPEDKESSALLSSFKNMIENYKQKSKKPFLNQLDTTYKDAIKDIVNTCERFDAKEKINYLSFISHGKMSIEDVQTLAECPDLTLKEFKQVHELPQKSITQINDYKKDKKIRTFLIYKTQDKDLAKNLSFTLDFYPETPLREKMRMISKFHAQICGPNASSQKSLQREFKLISLIDDIKYTTGNDLEPTFNIIKYLDSKTLGDYEKLTSEDVFNLPEDSKEHKDLKEHLLLATQNLNIYTEKYKNLLSVLNDRDILDDMLGDRHAILRFVGRIVLKNNSETTDLAGDSQKYIDMLKNELAYTLDSEYKVKQYTHPHIKGYNPVIFLKRQKSDLGKNIKIALLKDGRIHTIFSVTDESKKKVSPAFATIGQNRGGFSPEDIDVIYAKYEDGEGEEGTGDVGDVEEGIGDVEDVEEGTNSSVNNPDKTEDDNPPTETPEVPDMSSTPQKPSVQEVLLKEFGSEKLSKLPLDYIVDAYKISDGNMNFVSDMINGFDSYELRQVLDNLHKRFLYEYLFDAEKMMPEEIYNNIVINGNYTIEVSWRDENDIKIIKNVREVVSNSYKKEINEQDTVNKDPKELYKKKIKILKQLNLFGFIHLSDRFRINDFSEDDNREIMFNKR